MYGVYNNFVYICFEINFPNVAGCVCVSFQASFRQGKSEQ